MKTVSEWVKSFFIWIALLIIIYFIFLGASMGWYTGKAKLHQIDNIVVIEKCNKDEK